MVHKHAEQHASINNDVLVLKKLHSEGAGLYSTYNMETAICLAQYCLPGSKDTYSAQADTTS